MILWQLVRRGMYPAGLYRSLARRPAKESVAADEPASPA
jgi:hypothetical protein